MAAQHCLVSAHERRVRSCLSFAKLDFRYVCMPSPNPHDSPAIGNLWRSMEIPNHRPHAVNREGAEPPVPAHPMPVEVAIR
jgi:hypothetical protein